MKFNNWMKAYKWTCAEDDCCHLAHVSYSVRDGCWVCIPTNSLCKLVWILAATINGDLLRGNTPLEAVNSYYSVIYAKKEASRERNKR